MGEWGLLCRSPGLFDEPSAAEDFRVERGWAELWKGETEQHSLQPFTGATCRPFLPTLFPVSSYGGWCLALCLPSPLNLALPCAASRLSAESSHSRDMGRGLSCTFSALSFSCLYQLQAGNVKWNIPERKRLFNGYNSIAGGVKLLLCLTSELSWVCMCGKECRVCTV